MRSPHSNVGSVPVNQRVTRPRWLPKWWQFLLAGCCALMGSVVTFSAGKLLQGSLATIASMIEADGVAVRGGRIEIIVSYAVARICPTRTDRALWRFVEDPADGGKLIPEIVPLQSGGVVVPHGVGRYLLSLSFPDNIAPGKWYYISRTVYECPVLGSLWHVPITQSPDVPVIILDQAGK